MSEDRLKQLQEEHGAIGLVSAALEARDLYDQGIVCECAEPILVGYALMCRVCLRENMGQRERKEAAMAASHPFEPHRRVPFMCAFCSMYEDDPRHVGAAPVPEGGGE